MVSQWTHQLSALDYSQSFHYSFPPMSAIVQISLSNRFDQLDAPQPYADAFFTSMTTSSGFEGLDEASNFAASGLREVYGVFLVGGCSAQAIVNVFVWPFVLGQWGYSQLPPFPPIP